MYFMMTSALRHFEEISTSVTYFLFTEQINQQLETATKSTTTQKGSVTSCKVRLEGLLSP
jgi:hypothetical protein